MIHSDKNMIGIQGSMIEVMVDLTTVMRRMLEHGFEPKDLHVAADLAAMTKEEIQKETDRLHGINKMVRDAFDAARKD